MPTSPSYSPQAPLIIGPYTLNNNLIVAPMAGVTDRPFRTLCRHFGAGHAVSEMMTADQALYARKKSLFRADFKGELSPVTAQIAGSDPLKLAAAARFQVQNGAQIVDINMGCPVKKVCNRLAGSALLQDEALVRQILETVVAAVDVPVTLKTRLGFTNGQENILRIAEYAQNAGIAALAIHGRTREDLYLGQARYDLIAEVKNSVHLPIIANGDINTPERAAAVLSQTGADGLMIGRAAQGRPWIFREILYFLQTGHYLPPPTVTEIHQVLMQHLDDLYDFYGEYSGCRIARKHIAWYTQGLHDSNAFRQAMYTCESTQTQARFVDGYFRQLMTRQQFFITTTENPTF